jgi:hypothetical protein
VSRRVVVVASVLAAFSAFVIWALQAPSEKQYLDMVASLRAAGEPVDYDGLVTTSVAPKDNGAAGLRDASKWLNENLGAENQWTVVGAWNASCKDPWQETSTPAEIAELTAFLEKADQYFANVAAAVAKPALRFDAGRRDAFGFPEDNGIAVIQQTMRMLGARARAAPDGARRLDAIACEAAIAGRLDAVTIIDRMVAMAAAGAAISDVRREVAAGRIDPAAARARLDPLLRRPWLPTIRTGLRCERVVLIRAYAITLDGTFPGPRRPWYRNIVPKAWGGSAGDEWYHAGMAAEIVEECGRLDRAFKVPLAPLAVYHPAVIAELKGASNLAATHVMTYDRLIPAAARMESAQNLARVALAVAELHATTGAWPASLDDVAPMFPDGVPRDPLTGEAFVYVRTKSGATIAAPPGEALAVSPIYSGHLSWEFGR